MKSIEVFIEHLLSEKVSDETHAVINGVVQVCQTFKELSDMPTGSELANDVIVRFTVSEDSINEIYRACGLTLHHPSKSLPYWYIRLEDGRFKIDFQTEPVALYFKHGKEFSPITN